MKVLLGVGLLVGVPGCTSINCRSTAGEKQQGWDALVYSSKYVFPGVEGDLKGMTAPCRSGSGDEPQAGASVFGSVWSFFDLPFSFLADTVCLPYDLYKVSCGGKTRTGVDRNVDEAEE